MNDSTAYLWWSDDEPITIIRLGKSSEPGEVWR